MKEYTELERELSALFQVPLSIFDGEPPNVAQLDDMELKIDTTKLEVLSIQARKNGKYNLELEDCISLVKANNSNEK